MLAITSANIGPLVIELNQNDDEIKGIIALETFIWESDSVFKPVSFFATVSLTRGHWVVIIVPCSRATAELIAGESNSVM